jgi:hypothetical protein
MPSFHRGRAPPRSDERPLSPYAHSLRRKPADSYRRPLRLQG